MRDAETQTVNGASLACRERGSGPALVLVHGSASDYRTWHDQLAVFSERYRVIAYSRRYHWPNDPISDAGDYSMNEHVDDLQALVHSFDAVPAHLAGHSYGAFLCLLLAIRQPSLVRTLVLAEPPVVPLFVSDPPRPTELLLLAARPRTAIEIIRFGVRGVAPAKQAFRRGDMAAGARIFGDTVFGPGGFDRLSETSRTQVRDNLSNVRAEVLGPGLAPLEAAALRSLDMPVLLVTGEKSIGLFRRLTDRLEALLPNAERVEIPGATHMMHVDNAGAFNRAVLAFLDRHRGTAAHVSRRDQA